MSENWNIHVYVSVFEVIYFVNGQKLICASCPQQVIQIFLKPSGVRMLAPECNIYEP